MKAQTGFSKADFNANRSANQLIGSSLQAIPTYYKDTQLRSRMEAQCAFLFDTLGMEWVYEPRSYMLSNGALYLPDFWLPRQRAFVECRGYAGEQADSQIAAFGRDVTEGQTCIDGLAILRYIVLKAADVRCYRPRHEEYSEAVLSAYCACCEAWVFIGLGEPECPLCSAHACSITLAHVVSCTKGKILLNQTPSEYWDGLLSVSRADGGTV